VNSYHKNNIELQQEMQQVEAAKLNPERFGVLYDAYYKSIFVFVYRRTGDENVTADITSQVFLKALLNIKKYVFKGVPFSAWLFRIALNEVAIYFRKNSASRVISLDQKDIVQIVQEVNENNSEFEQQQVLLTIKQLNLDDIQLIELRFFEKHSFAEIAGIVGITEANAKVKTYRILDKLKKLLYKKIKS
jgi:RNA polymerase sigma-70 factor (ECF subfamily)